MQLQATTDYGIRVMCCLYERDTLITATELAELLCISYPYLIRVLGQLRQAGMIEVTRGRHGGYRIARHARDITLYDIIKTMEGEIKINSCMNKDGVCSRNARDICPVYGILKTAQAQLVDSLERVSLCDIAGISWKERIVTTQTNQAAVLQRIAPKGY